MLRPTANFKSILAREGLSVSALACQAGISRANLFGWLNPDTQTNRKGGMRITTAWKLAHAYAGAAKITPDVAFSTLFIEVNEVVPEDIQYQKN